MDCCEKKRILENEDRISELPDPILCKILSLLPTKFAFATSVLSTRWYTLFPFWTPPITLDFDDTVMLYPQKNRTGYGFTNFVEKNLSLVSCVDVVMLTCLNYYDHILSWVDSALGLKVRELLLDVDMKGESESLFAGLNGNTTLTRLKLCLGPDIALSLRNKFNLPNLKSLLLSELELDDINEMIVGCPLLEELCLSSCVTSDYGDIHIQSHLLKKLTIKGTWNESKCGLTIDAPNLETLLYDDTVSSGFYVSDFRSLRMAHIDLCQTIRAGDELVGYYGCDGEEDEDEYDTELKLSWFHGVEKLVKACSTTSQLYLGFSSIYVLQESMELPEFQELSSLTISHVWGPKGWAFLADLLSKSPNLKKLTINKGLSRYGFSSFESSLVSTPLCLELHLKEIDLFLSEYEEDEIKLVEYLLNNGKVLHTLKLHCLPFKKDSSFSRLNMLPGHSKIIFQPRQNGN